MTESVTAITLKPYLAILLQSSFENCSLREPKENYFQGGGEEVACPNAPAHLNKNTLQWQPKLLLVINTSVKQNFK